MNDETMIDLTLSESPYPGLRAFNHTEADIFFGRESQSDRLLEKLGNTRFISVVGLSGCGKSSLVRAGLIPNLESGFLVEAGPYWRIATMRPSNSPMRHLAEALLDDTALGVDTGGGKPPDGNDELPFLLAALRRGPLGLVEALQDTPLPAHTNLLIVVDQFEELFRHHREGGSDETEAFVNLLLKSAEQDQVPIYVVTTMRSEYIGDCTLFHGLPEMMNEGQFLVPRLTREQQEMAIISPAGLFEGAIDDRLVNNLLNQMGNDPDQLPLLQHCLMRMWSRKTLHNRSDNGQPEDDITLTLQDYEAVGELENALSNHADEAFAELDAHGQQVTELLFRCLSDRDPSHRNIRRPVSLNEAATVAGSEAKVREVVEVFRRDDRCFLTPNVRMPLTSDSVLDISHESLIRQWKRMKAWVKDEADSSGIYRSLEKRARYWKQLRHDPKWLWDSPDLDIAQHWKQQERPSPEWAVRYGNHFPLAMKFLAASAEAQEEKRAQEERAREEKIRQEEWAKEEKLRRQERERRLQLKHTRQLLTGALIALVVAVSLAGWGFMEKRSALKNKQLAVKQKEKTEKTVSFSAILLIEHLDSLQKRNKLRLFLTGLKKQVQQRN